MGNHSKRERETCGRKERERGGLERMQSFVKTEDKSLIDVETVETTYFDNCAFFAALTSFLLQMSFHVYFVAILFRSGVHP